MHKRLENIKFFRRYNDPQKEGLSLKIRLTNKCNNNCHYCFYRDNSSAFLDLNKVYKFISALSDKHRYFYIYLHGGEPTLHPEFLDFLSKINVLFINKNIDYFIYFDTNFTKNLAFWLDFHIMTDVSKTKVNCTFHPSQCSNIELFLKKFDILKCLKQLNIMVEYDNFDHCRDIFYLCSNQWNVVPKPIFFKENELKYSDDQKKFFYENDKTRQFYYVDDHGEHIFSLNQIELEGLNDFFMMKCEYKNNIVIDVNGDIYYCVSHQLSNGNPIMNIHKDGISRYFDIHKPNICIFRKCSACDLRILKQKI